MEKNKAPSQWQKGMSGNPQGKPKGAKNKTTLIKQALEGQLVEQLAEDASDILAKAIHMAKQGDAQMIKLVLDKLLPNAKGDGIQIDKGSGGINIIVSGIEKPTINAERINEDE